MELEQTAEVRRLAVAMARRATPDFEAWETLLLQAARHGGAAVLAALLQDWQTHCLREVVLCACGQRMRSHGRRIKSLQTILGTVPFARSLYRCQACAHTRFPQDERLDMVRTSYSPGVRRLMARAGSQTQFEQAADDLLCYAGLKIEAREIERVAEEVGREVEQWLSQDPGRVLQPTDRPSPAIPKLYVSFDGTGVPVRRAELIGRRGKQPDGSARTREAKLGCVFTQVGVDNEGRPQRDPDSTSYVGAIESSELFGWRMYAESVRRGLAQAQQVIALTDGARYNHTIVRLHFPRAIHIVDLFHAFEHLGEVAVVLWGPAAQVPKPWRDRLEAGEIKALLRKVGKQLPGRGESKQRILKALHYFEENEAHMRYAEFRSKKLFVGSGVVEAGCRTVIGQRLKLSGMRWSVRGANAIIALRCCLMSGRFEDFWASRTG